VTMLVCVVDEVLEKLGPGFLAIALLHVLAPAFLRLSDRWL
jgi:hypothetical protein